MKLFTVLIALVLTSTIPAIASDYHSPRTAALGGAGHAGPLTNDAIYLNPSYTSFMKAYSVSGSYASFEGESTHGRLYNVSVLDGRSDLFQAGVGYTVRDDGAWVHLGASKTVVQRMGFGLGGKLQLIDGQPASRELMLSTTFIPATWLQASITIDNLIQDEKSKERGLYREFVLGTKFLLMGIAMAYIDPHYAPDVPGQDALGYEIGGEFTLMKDLFLRAGHFKNANVPYQSARGRGIGMGFGWVGPRLSLDYAYQRVLESNEEGIPPANSHVFGMTVFF